MNISMYFGVFSKIEMGYIFKTPLLFFGEVAGNVEFDVEGYVPERFERASEEVRAKKCRHNTGFA